MVRFVSQWQWWRRTDISLQVLTNGTVRTGSGKLFQIRGAAELKARLANIVLSAGKAGGGQMIGVGVSVYSHSAGPIGGHG